MAETTYPLSWSRRDGSGDHERDHGEQETDGDGEQDDRRVDHLAGPGTSHSQSSGHIVLYRLGEPCADISFTR